MPLFVLGFLICHPLLQNAFHLPVSSQTSSMIEVTPLTFHFTHVAFFL